MDEYQRISSVKLALMTQLDQLILSRLKIPYKKLFPPSYEKIDPTNFRIKYRLKNNIYEGGAIEQKDI